MSQRIRLLAAVALAVAPLCTHPGAAFAAGCDSVKYFTLETAEKNAFYNHDFATLLPLNVEHATYADACGHHESGASRTKNLIIAVQHYTDAATTELGRKQFSVAKKHFSRSNAIIAELLHAGVDADQRRLLMQQRSVNESGLWRAARHQSTAA